MDKVGIMLAQRHRRRSSITSTFRGRVIWVVAFRATGGVAMRFVGIGTAMGCGAVPLLNMDFG